MKSSEVCIRTESTLAKRLILLKGQVAKYTIVAFGLQIYFRTKKKKRMQYLYDNWRIQYVHDDWRAMKNFVVMMGCDKLPRKTL